MTVGGGWKRLSGRGLDAVRGAPGPRVGDGRFGAVFLVAPGEGEVFFGDGFLGPDFGEPPEAALADLVGDFFAVGLAAAFVTAFQLVSQTMQDTSDL